MDTNYTAQLALSMLFFAPGVILFVGLAFVGILMVLEKTVFKAQSSAALNGLKAPIELPANANPQPGPIVNALKDSVQQPVAHKSQRKANK